jgi:hypothetical protein
MTKRESFSAFRKSLKMLAVFWVMLSARAETLDDLNVPAHDAGEG